MLDKDKNIFKFGDREVNEMQKFMTISEVAELTRYKKETIRLFVKLGQLKAYRRRAKQSELRFRPSDINAFMEGKGPVGRKRKVEKRR